MKYCVGCHLKSPLFHRGLSLLCLCSLTTLHTFLYLLSLSSLTHLLLYQPPPPLKLADTENKLKHTACLRDEWVSEERKEEWKRRQRRKRSPAPWIITSSVWPWRVIVLIFELCLVTDITWLADWIKMVGIQCLGLEEKVTPGVTWGKGVTIMRPFPVSCM